MANKLLFVNNATSALLGNVGPTDVSMAILNGEGGKFPAPTDGFSFMLTLEDSAGNIEIVECTNRAGDILTVIRGREGTTARAFVAGDTVEARITAGALNYLNWQTSANLANGPLALGANGKAPASTIDTTVTAICDPRYQTNIGFTPVEQGGGTGMSTNKIRFGWSSAGILLAQVDSTGFQVPLRTAGGTVLQLTNNARCRVQTNTTLNEDELFLGPLGWYFYGNSTDGVGLYHPTKGFGFRFVDGASPAFNVNASILQFGTQVSVNGHTHTIANISGLQTILDDKFDNDGGTIGGNTTVSGTLTATVSVRSPSIVDTSDERLKRNIVPMTIEDAETIVRGTVGVRFFNTMTNANEFGVVAQQQALVSPEIVPQGADGMYAVSYQRLVAPLAVVVQNLMTRLALAEAKIAALEAQGGGA